jgi:hypothetical protein
MTALYNRADLLKKHLQTKAEEAGIGFDLPSNIVTISEVAPNAPKVETVSAL